MNEQNTHPLIPDYSKSDFKRLKKRHRTEGRFKLYGISAIIGGGIFLAMLLIIIGGSGWTAFIKTEVKIDIALDEAIIDPNNTRDVATLEKANYNKIVKASLREQFEGVKSRRDKKAVYKMVSKDAYIQVRDYVVNNPDQIGQKTSLWVTASSTVDMIHKGHVKLGEQNQRNFSTKQEDWLTTLKDENRLRKVFNKNFVFNADSREPEIAGIAGAFIGSLWVVFIAILVAFPIGVAAAVYLEEFASKNRFADIIEINLNNLAAVPSIVYGLLGFAIFLHFGGMPRSSAVVGGLTLSLLTLPIIVIAARSALTSVPNSIRYAAIGLGASPVQVVFHHTLPAALPGIMTGTILSIARIIGETAPLLMIGMVAFIADVPSGLNQPATVMPVQIYLWADSPEVGYREKTAAAILVLLGILAVLNIFAAWIRKKFEIKW